MSCIARSCDAGGDSVWVWLWVRDKYLGTLGGRDSAGIVGIDRGLLELLVILAY